MFPQTVVPSWVRLQSIQTLQQMGSPSGTAWVPIGPKPVNNGGNPYAGRVWSLAVNPQTPSTVYAGADGGGVWKTVNSGTTWTPVSAAAGITSLVIDPQNPNTIYAGTGGSAYPGGILKSTDGGATWTQILAPFVTGNGFSTPINCIAVSPTNSAAVLAATDSGVYRSTDGGATWNPSLPGAAVSEVLFDPTNGSPVYASRRGYGVEKSVDGGVSWSPANGAGAYALPATVGAVNIAIAPSSPSTLYAAVKGTNSLLLGFYKTADRGATWVPITTPAGDNIAYWNWSLRVDPADPNVLYAGSLTLSRSLDGGITWTDLGFTFNPPHPHHHAQAFTPDGSTLYVATDGGIWSTSTPSAPSLAWTNLNATFSTVLLSPGFSMLPSDKNTAYFGSQEEGALRYYLSAFWVPATCTDGGWTGLDFTQAGVAYVSCSGVDIRKYNGVSWTQASTGIVTTDNVSYLPPLVMDPSNAQRLYFGTSRVYQTNNGAGVWTPISPDLTGGSSVVTAIAVAPSDSNTVYAGSFGYLYVTRNAGTGTGSSWTNVSAGLPYRAVTQIAVSPTDPQTAYATFSGFAYWDGIGHIYRTTNAGASWSNITGNLPDIPVNDLAIDPDVAGTLYAATDIGVFRSIDAGSTWQPFSNGLPAVIVTALKLHRATRTLRAATCGRGAWDFSLGVTTGQPDLTISKTHTGNFTQGQMGVSYTILVSNVGTAATNGTVTVLEYVPTGLTATSISGAGWTCSQPAGPCARSDSLAAGASYPAITFTANVSASAPTLLTNSVAVSGGGETNTVNDSASDPTTIAAAAPSGAPDLTISKTHSGNFTQGQMNAAYTIVVSNTGAGPTSGIVRMTELLPAGLTATSISGYGWSCTQPSGPCTRTDSLGAGASYSAISLTVNVSSSAVPALPMSRRCSAEARSTLPTIRRPT
jgi:uncharacterized repeat protein (TIGR01451 family)